jgi:hypothetical protein
VRLASAAAVAFVALVAGAGASAEPFGRTTAIPVPKGHAVRAAVLADVDGDGRDDVVIATRRVGKRAARTIRVHVRQDGESAFAPEPSATLDLYDNVTAFAVGDVDPEPGAEVILFTANGVYAWRTRAPEERRIVRLVEASFLFQYPDPKEAFAFEPAVRDVDGDGLVDLVVPEPEGYRVAVQRRDDSGSHFAAPSFLRVPEDVVAGEAGETPAARRMRARAARREIRIALQFGGDGAVAGDLLNVTERVPAPQLADFDGDGRLDVLAQTPHQLHVWRQRADRTFPEPPDASYDLPVTVDRRRRFDVSYSAQTADLDGDRRTDCVLFAGDKNSDDVRTQILLYTQKGGSEASPLFGDKGLPRQLLVVAGFAGTPRLVDVDGDGRADLTAGSMRLDALDAVAAAAKGTLDAELYVYRNRGGVLSRTPDLTFPLSVRAEGLRKGREGLLAQFVADATGDGVRDLLLRDEPTRLRLYLVRRAGEGLSVVPQPLFETFLPEDAKVVVRENGGPAPEVLIVEDAQVRHVRFR